MLQLSTGVLSEDKRPRTPNPDDQSVSKRFWESKVMRWRRELKKCSAKDMATYKDVCLVTALRTLGAPVEYERGGPFRAMTDGNPMLLPFRLRLVLGIFVPLRLI